MRCFSEAELQAHDAEQQRLGRELVAPAATALRDLLSQVKFVLVCCTPQTPQQREVWPELVRRAEAAETAVKVAAVAIAQEGT